MHQSLLPPAPCSGKFILASNSPRRRQLLQLIVPEFTIAPSRDIDEKYPDYLSPLEVAPWLSRLKANAYADLVQDTHDTTLITADTVVICNKAILGKPADENQAVEMLQTLSNKTHTVVTGVTLLNSGRYITFAEHTNVHFAKLSLEEIQQYVQRFHPLDKAGAYGIQEWIGCIGITGIDGCFYNVMGLPLHALFTHLRKLNTTK